MKIICFGDSNTYGYDPRGFFGGRYDHSWPEMLADKLDSSVLNWGENGREIPAGIVDFPADADLVIIMLGTNDLLQGASSDVACKRMERFLKPLRREKVLLVAPPPMRFGAWVSSQRLIDNSAALSGRFRILADRLGIRFADAGEWSVPLAYDGVHLTEDGHVLFANKLVNTLNATGG